MSCWELFVRPNLHPVDTLMVSGASATLNGPPPPFLFQKTDLPMTDLAKPRVQNDSHVTFHYQLTLEDGQLVLDTFGERPATIQMGLGQFSPGLERCMLALEEGEDKVYELGAEDAFGPRNPELIQHVSKQLLDEHTDPADPLQAGDLLEFPTPDGERFAGVFKGWEGEAAVFDFNHPLAGQALKFRVQIVGVL